MNDQSIPEKLLLLESKCEAIGFNQPSDRAIGYLLRTLIASKPQGTFLELGTGIGLSLAWMIDGMEPNSRLISIDNDPKLIEIAKEHFGSDDRVSICCTDGEIWINDNIDQEFDLIFSDTWPGKYNHLNEVLSMVKVGGFYVIDDMREQSNWPDGHSEKAKTLINELKQKKNFHFTHMPDWSTGVMIGTRTS